MQQGRNPCSDPEKCQAGRESFIQTYNTTSAKFPEVNPVNACQGFPTELKLQEASLVVSSEFYESVWTEKETGICSITNLLDLLQA